MIVKISRDNKFIFFANNLENFIIENIKTQNGDEYEFILVKLNHEKKVIRLISEDPKGGFYYQMCEDYDETLMIKHSHQKQYSVTIDHSSQPGNIKFLDMCTQSRVLDNENNKIEHNLNIIGLDDFDFYLEMTTWEADLN